MFFKSIRFKIIIWYMMILTITLTIFSISLYQDFTSSLYKNVDDRLMSKADGISASIDTYWETEKLEAIRDGAPANVFTKLNNINFIKIAKHWVEEKSEDPKFINNFVQIFNSKGKLIISSKELPLSKTLDPLLLKNINRKPFFSNIEIQSSEGSPLDMRILTISVKENAQTAYVVQVGTSLTPVHAARDSLKTLLFIFLPITVFLTGILGAFLAKLTLKPVDDMIHAIRQIKASNLKARIPLPGTKDEIERLAKTFNNMLGELDKVFSYQQQFIQDASHELRTPLTIIKGEFEVIMKKPRPAHEYQEVMKSSLEEINKIIKIIENLLTLAKFDCQQIPVKFVNFSLSDLIIDIIQNIKVLADNKNITIACAVTNQIKIEGDSSLISRMLINIIENAIKYTPDNGDIAIKLIIIDGSAAITVADTGIGIPENELPYIFDRFYRVDKSRHFNGFGLGLSIVKSIIDIHSGTIAAESIIDKGSSFIITLPVS